MKRTALLIVPALLVGIVAGSVCTRALYAQQSPITRTDLTKKDLVGIEGKEAVMYRAEIVAGGQSGRHYHPGTEIVYVLSGSGALEMDGQSAMELKEGVSGIIPPKQIHNAKNTGGAPLKILVVAIHPKGEPPVVPIP